MANTREAVRSLALARQRTVLGIVGIVIGIASIISMISVGLIVKQESLRHFESLGTDLLVVHGVHPPDGGRPRMIPLADAVELAAQVPAVLQASPRLYTARQVVYAGREIARSQISGVTASFADIVDLELQEGRFVSDLDERSYFCVVGAEVARAMRRAGAKRIVGEVVKFNKRRYTVAGVLVDTPDRKGLSLDIDVNRSVFIPIRNAQRVFPEQDIRMVAARSSRSFHYTTATEQIQAYFKRRTKGLTVGVDSATQLIEQMEKQMQLWTLLLGTVGSIALIVGGIGIMNIMIASVSERKAEVGLRRALGARRSDIQGQFLIEAVVLCVLGGVVGTAVGAGATYVVCRFTGWDFFVSWLSIVLGIGVASTAGIFFGFQPAYQAARLNPIDALHAR